MSTFTAPSRGRRSGRARRHSPCAAGRRRRRRAREASAERRRGTGQGRGAGPGLGVAARRASLGRGDVCARGERRDGGGDDRS